ncbi:MAG TPA: hypothetical protein VFE24_13140 [Pirellulales bacterium]|nr:hypothetical protein [Pirellulales bacterium]
MGLEWPNPAFFLVAADWRFSQWGAAAFFSAAIGHRRAVQPSFAAYQIGGRFLGAEDRAIAAG